MNNYIMIQALELARNAAVKNEVPVGAIIFNPISKKIISKTHNQVELLKDPTAHAEMLAIKEACSLTNSKLLEGLELYVTLEPCAMCLQAICFAQIKTMYFGAYDYKRGAISANCGIIAKKMNNFQPEIYGGIMEIECSELLNSFFKQIRTNAQDKKR
jgi:tRNA(adenine34) deaminase